MSVNLETSSDWDRTLLDLSSKLSEPFCTAWHLFTYRLVAPLDPVKFENCTTRTKEIATRILIVLGGVMGIAACITFPIAAISIVASLGVTSKLLRAAGFALQKGGYTHVRGKANEKTLDPQTPQVKVTTWNLCGVGGGMSLDHGGVVHFRSRLDKIVEQIKEEDPDVLVLQEVYDTALAEALIDKLQSDYAHFFTHLGPNVMGSVGGCMVISKCAIHQFSNTSFHNNKWTLNRGFADLEIKATPDSKTPCLRVIGTHLIHGDAPIDKLNRQEQVAQIVDHIAKKTLALPTILAGDLNIERDGKEGKVLSDFRHSYLGIKPTCTNRLVSQWDLKTKSVWEETIDYISLLKSERQDGTRIANAVDHGVELKDCHLVEAFDESPTNTKTARSDHHGVTVTVITKRAY